ncbi:MAG: hypothetical protein IAI50_11000 [Candidatus Eremiobacteraeota bacterium]|nr:hypothetical protein [Candidatus Eremiobacteraeota bacterium]
MKRSALTAPLRKLAGPTFAVESTQLRSFAFLARAIGFWTHRMRRIPCPTCGVVGALDIDIRSYGVRFACDNCNFEELEVFEAGGPKRPQPPIVS